MLSSVPDNAVALSCGERAQREAAGAQPDAVFARVTSPMPRNLLRRWLPSDHHFRQERSLRFFGRLLHNRDLWHINRRSAARAAAVGLFIAFVPLPGQTILAAALAIWLGCNLPLAVVAVWVTNPVTVPFVFYGAYELGAWLLGIPPRNFHLELSLGWLMERIDAIWQPLLLGCLILGTLSALVGYALVHLLWRLHVARSWRRRQEARAARAPTPPGRGGRASPSTRTLPRA